MTNLEQLTLAAWRGYTTALHTALHGGVSAEKLVFDEATFKALAHPSKLAMRACATEVIKALAEMAGPSDVQTLVHQTLIEPAPVLLEHDADAPVSKKEPPASGWPGAAS